MITKKAFSDLSDLSEQDLYEILYDTGYYDCLIVSSVFSGNTETESFRYEIEFIDDSGTGDLEKGNVFVRYDNTAGCVVAEF